MDSQGGSKLTLCFHTIDFICLADVCLSEMYLLSVTIYSLTEVHTHTHTYTHVDDVVML